MTRPFAILVLVCSLAACSHPGSGEATVTAVALSTSDIDHVTLTISGPGMTDIVTDLTKVGATFQGTVTGIPAGPARIFDAEAYDNTGTVIYSGTSAPVTIVAGNIAAIELQLSSTMPPDPFHNHAPIIDSLFASSATVVPGGTIDLAATAHDPDGDPLVITWSGPGMFSDPLSLTTPWVAPFAVGTYTISLSVTDPHGAFDTIAATIDVTDAATGAATVVVAFNTSPQVDDVIDEAGRILPNIPSTVRATASDPDGDMLTYAWSDDCGGTWTGTGDTVQLVIPSVATPTCTLRVDIDDGHGGTNYGTLVVQVGPPPQPTFPPVIDLTTQSSTTVDHGGQVAFSVQAHDPQGEALAYQWTANQGSFTTATTAASATWQAPPCITTAGYITVTITDTDGEYTVKTFEIDPVSTSCVPDGLVAWLTGDGTTADTTGTLQLMGGVGYTTGVRGQAFLLAPGENLTGPAAGVPIHSADRTLEFWARLDDESQESDIVGWGVAGFAEMFEVGVLGPQYSNQPFFTNWGLASGTSTVAVGAWHHYAAVSQGSAVTLYLDGNAIDTTMFSLDTSAGSFWIGGGDTTGAVDEVRVFNRALAADEIARIAAGNAY